MELLKQKQDELAVLQDEVGSLLAEKDAQERAAFIRGAVEWEVPLGLFRAGWRATYDAFSPRDATYFLDCPEGTVTVFDIPPTVYGTTEELASVAAFLTEQTNIPVDAFAAFGLSQLSERVLELL